MADYLKGDRRVEVSLAMKEAYNQGSSIRTIAKRTGRSYGSVHMLLLEAGVVLRTRGGDTRKG